MEERVSFELKQHLQQVSHFNETHPDRCCSATSNRRYDLINDAVDLLQE